MTRPRLLDLFCGAGGAAMGYHRAGFDVVGVDIKPQPNYPFLMRVADALSYLRDMPSWELRTWDAIHASPPCQAYTQMNARWRGKGGKADSHPDLLGPTRELVKQTGLPYVIENVPGAPLRHDIVLCGSSFGLNVKRHRIFETNWPICMLLPPCAHHWQAHRFRTYDDRRDALSSVVPVYGQGRRVRAADGVTLSPSEDRRLRAEAMGIDWMTDAELAEAIPPAYTELIGLQLLEHVRRRAA